MRLDFLRGALAGGVLTLALAAAAWSAGRPEPPEPLARSAALARSSDASLPGVVFDPLLPERPARLIGPVSGDDWVDARPDAIHAYSLPPAARDGVAPCNSPEPDPGALTPWLRLPSFGQVVAPRRLLISGATEFDLVLHFHGHEPARKELARAGVPLVLFGVSIEPGRSYERLLAGGPPIATLLSEIEDVLAETSGRALSLRHVALSAWSAGFVGVRALLRGRGLEQVRAVLLLDGLHAARNQASLDGDLRDFVELARRAESGGPLFVVTHSSIDPPSFASTTETAHRLIAAVGGRPLRVERRDAYGLELVEFHSRGNFHVRGYAGNDKADHCAQFGAYRDLLRALARHLSSAG